MISKKGYTYPPLYAFEFFLYNSDTSPGSDGGSPGDSDNSGSRRFGSSKLRPYRYVDVFTIQTRVLVVMEGRLETQTTVGHAGSAVASFDHTGTLTSLPFRHESW